jgi:hypothetical protein
VRCLSSKPNRHMTFSGLKRQSKTHTGIALAQLDERIARSAVGQGWIERSHLTDACASLWIDSELLHLEDLVLHDATRDVRTPTHELTIARDVLKTRWRMASQPPGWALSAEGLSSLRGQGRIGANAVADSATSGVQLGPKPRDAVQHKCHDILARSNR